MERSEPAMRDSIRQELQEHIDYLQTVADPIIAEVRNTLDRLEEMKAKAERIGVQAYGAYIALGLSPEDARKEVRKWLNCDGLQ